MKDEEFIQKGCLNVLDSIDNFIIQDKEQEKIIKTFLDIGKDKIIKDEHRHQNFRNFQDKYGIIPASDKNNMHLVKSRMLQGVYRDKKDDSVYCNIVLKNGSFINFMQNADVENDAKKELENIQNIHKRSTDKKRLFINLLSSQPLAFNIFLPLKWNKFELGNTVFKELFPFLNIKELIDIKMEYVPNDEIKKITRDDSCFDVFMKYKNNNDEIGGIGIEVKYTETFSQSNYYDIEKIKIRDKKILPKRKFSKNK